MALTLVNSNSDHIFATQVNPINLAQQRKERSILKDLETLGIDENVRNAANAIYANLGIHNPRKSPRKQIVFFCVCEAYRSLGIHKDPYELSQKMELSKRDMNAAYRLCSETRTGVYIPVTMTKPSDLLPDFAKRLGLIGDYGDLLLLANRIVEQNKNLLDRTPQSVAAGILNYYCQTRGVDIPLSQISTTFGISELNIKNITNTIAEIDNS
jgi:transcription initiation factor TFIIIB Brf1 subunit/transcription initiation factor TFIIB